MVWLLNTFPAMIITRISAALFRLAPWSSWLSTEGFILYHIEG